MASPSQALFVDTSAWVALLHRRDQAHARAARLWPAIRAGRRELVTTDVVLAETHTLLLHRLGSEAALGFLDRLLFRRHQRIVWADADLALAATERWLRPRPAQPLTFTDAVSFETMRREGIREAFAFDQDFVQAGFELL